MQKQFLQKNNLYQQVKQHRKTSSCGEFHHFLTRKIFDAKEHNLTIWANLSE